MGCYGIVIFVPLIENVKVSVISAVNFGNSMSRFVKDASKISVPDVPKDFIREISSSRVISDDRSVVFAKRSREKLQQNKEKTKLCNRILVGFLGIGKSMDKCKK